MFVRVCAVSFCACTCVRVRMYIWASARAFVCLLVGVRVCVCVCVFVSACVYVYASASVCVLACACVFARLLHLRMGSLGIYQPSEQQTRRQTWTHVHNTYTHADTHTRTDDVYERTTKAATTTTTRTMVMQGQCKNYDEMLRKFLKENKPDRGNITNDKRKNSVKLPPNF